VELLSLYPFAVLQRAISPSRGIASRIAYPNMARFKECLEEWHAEHIEDLKRRGIKPGWKPEERSAPRIAGPDPKDAPDGSYANVFVPSIHDRYTKLVEWAKTADRRKWKFGKSSTGHDGIWVSHDVWDQQADRHLKRVAMRAAE
jgi:hypothetical protein